MDDFLVIGEVVKPQGLTGELKVKPLTNDPHRFEELTHVFIKPTFERREISSVRVREGFVYLRLEGVESRETAEGARGLLLHIDREHAVPLSDDENFICDLIGCEVSDESGLVYGKLTDVLQPGANDVYVISGVTDGKKTEVLIPALKDVVTNVDVDKKRITLNSKRLSEVAVFAD